MSIKAKHPSGKPNRAPKVGVSTRIIGQAEGFLNPRLHGPWHDTHAVGFTDPRRQYQFDDEDEGKRR